MQTRNYNLVYQFCQGKYNIILYILFFNMTCQINL